MLITLSVYGDKIIFYYNLNWLLGKGSWTHGSLVHSTHIMEEQQNKKSLDQIRMDSPNKRMKYLVDNGGWHCSYCMSTDDIINKLHSFSHQEYNRYPYTSRTHIQDCITNGKSLFSPGSTDTIPSNHNFTKFLPQELQDFNEELALSQLT